MILTSTEKLIRAMYLLDMQEDEVWREINFLPDAKTNGNYFISNYGKVISLYNNEPKQLQPFLCGNADTKYYYVSICGKDYRINRLVAKAFIPNPDNKPIVHHKDHNKLNNHWTNLEWATASENALAYYKYKKEQQSE